MPHIVYEPCIGCGACVPVGPVSAIDPVEDVAAKWERFIQKHADLSRV